MQELKTGGIFIGFMPWEYESEDGPFNKDDKLGHVYGWVSRSHGQ